MTRHFVLVEKLIDTSMQTAGILKSLAHVVRTAAKRMERVAKGCLSNSLKPDAKINTRLMLGSRKSKG